MSRTIATIVEERAIQHPDRIALTFEGATFSYAELEIRAARAANAFARLGVAAGDRVALQLPNVPAHVWCYLGALKLGAIAVAVNPALTAAETRLVLRDSDPRLLVTAPGLPGAEACCQDGSHPVLLAGSEGDGGSLERAMAVADPERRAARVASGAAAAILYTSGTTGTPKGATLSHGNILFVAAAQEQCLALTGRDRLLLFLPLFHCFGQNAILNAALYAGATACLHRKFAVARIREAVREERTTLFFGVPTTFALLLDTPPEEFDSVRQFFSAAAPLPREIESRWLARFGRPILQGYGLTETSPFASYNHLTEYRPGSIGAALQGTEMCVVDVATKQPLLPGSPGEIIIRGPNVMLGYWNRPEETAAVVRDGWCYTGDIGRVDADGYFFIEDRLKDLVIVGGFNVYPAEVENVLLQHAAVREAAVHGVADAVMGERVRAVVVLRDRASADADELLAFCRERLAATKVPSEVAFVTELPRGNTGKILKRRLRETYRPPSAPDQPRVRDEATLERQLVAWLAARVGGANPIDPETPFADLGLTSLLAVQLATEVGVWAGRSVPPTVTWSHSTVRALVRHVLAPRALGLPASPDGSFDHLSDAEAEELLVHEISRVERDARA